jgi:twinkle protein
MSRRATKGPCEACGSSDNLAKFENGSEWCFTPGCPGNLQRGGGIKLKPFSPKGRGLREETLAKYGSGIGPDGNVWYPYYRDGKPVAHKLRTTDKRFFWEGDSKNASLFGLQCASGDRRLIITEGEFDAMAAYQMTGYPAVSGRNSQSLPGDVKSNLQFVESFDTVYVVTDMDEPGQDAAKKLMELLQPGKAMHVILPEGFKDPCDMLAAGKIQEFKSALFAGRPTKITGLASKEDIRSKALDLLSSPERLKGVDTGYESLNTLIGGLRPGEVTVLVGGTGVGKTAFSRQLAMNLAAQNQPVFFIPLEMPPDVVTLQMVEMHLGGDVITKSEFEYQQIAECVSYVTERISFFEHFGNIEPEKLCNVIEYVCRSTESRFVFLDHISAVVSGTEDERRGTDITIAGLKALALRTGAHVVVVSHMSRSKEDADDNAPTLSKIRHSAGIAQYADCVLGVSRTRSSNVATVETLKVSRLWGEYGRIKFRYINRRFKEEDGRTNDSGGNIVLDATGTTNNVDDLPDTPWEVTTDGRIDGETYVDSTDKSGIMVEEGFRLDSNGWQFN